MFRLNKDFILSKSQFSLYILVMLRIMQYINTFNAPLNWQTLSNLTGDGSVLTIFDSRTNGQRYYRVLQNP